MDASLEMSESTTEVIPVAEEQVLLEKRRVETGVVRVRTDVETRDDLVRDTLLHEKVEIERKPIGREVDAPPPVREEGDLLIVPVVEEILVVEKRLMLVEEIHLRRHRRNEALEQPVKLRRQRVSIEREPPPNRERDED